MTNATGGLDREVLHRDAEHERAVHVQVARHRLEVNPAPDQREGDRRGEQAAPHDQPVREPAQPAAPEDEAVGGELEQRAAAQADGVAGQRAAREERLPAAPPVHARRRPLQPHRVAIGDAERREERREGVADERRVEVLQVARADDDGRRQRGRDERWPTRRPGPARAPGARRPAATRVHATSPGRKTRWLATRSSERGRDSSTKPGQMHAEPVAEHAEQQRREEAAEAAERADQAGDRAGVLREVLRHQLEDGAVAQPQQRRAAERADRERHHRRPRQQQREQRDAAEDPRQHLRAADPVGQPAADAAASAWRARRSRRRGIRRRPAPGRTAPAAASAGRSRTRRSRRRSGSRRRRAARRSAARRSTAIIAATRGRTRRRAADCAPAAQKTTAQTRSSAPVPRKTICQPKRAATTGPTNTASDWPIVPRP